MRLRLRSEQKPSATHSEQRQSLRNEVVAVQMFALPREQRARPVPRKDGFKPKPDRDLTVPGMSLGILLRGPLRNGLHPMPPAPTAQSQPHLLQVQRGNGDPGVQSMPRSPTHPLQLRRGAEDLPNVPNVTPRGRRRGQRQRRVTPAWALASSPRAAGWPPADCGAGSPLHVRAPTSGPYWAPGQP